MCQKTRYPAHSSCSVYAGPSPYPTSPCLAHRMPCTPGLKWGDLPRNSCRHFIQEVLCPWHIVLTSCRNKNHFIN